MARPLKSTSADSSDARMKNLFFLALILGGSLPVLVPMLSTFYDFTRSYNFTHLPIPDEYTPTSDPTAQKQLAAIHHVFYSGEPAVVFCLNSTAAPPSTPPIAISFSDLAYSTLTIDAPMINTYTIDCTHKLPSDQTVLERFKLRAIASPYYPTAFYTANLDHPQLLSYNLLSDMRSTKDKNKIHSGAEKLLDFVRKNIQPQVRKILSQKTFESQCYSRKWCLLILQNSRKLSIQRTNTDTLSQALSPLLTMFRQVRFTYLDRNDWELTPLEKALPPLDDSITSEMISSSGFTESSYPRFFLFERKKAKDYVAAAGEEIETETVTLVKSFKGKVDKRELQQWIGEIVAEGSEVKRVRVKKIPQIRKRQKKTSTSSSSSSSKKSKKRQAEEAAAAQRTKEKEKAEEERVAKLTPEERQAEEAKKANRKKAEREREKRRREEKKQAEEEKKQKKQNKKQESEGEGESTQGRERREKPNRNREEEEEVIDLDDQEDDDEQEESNRTESAGEEEQEEAGAEDKAEVEEVPL